MNFGRVIAIFGLVAAGGVAYIWFLKRKSSVVNNSPAVNRPPASSPNSPSAPPPSSGNILDQLAGLLGASYGAQAYNGVTTSNPPAPVNSAPPQLNEEIFDTNAPYYAQNQMPQEQAAYNATGAIPYAGSIMEWLTGAGLGANLANQSMYNPSAIQSGAEAGVSNAYTPAVQNYSQAGAVTGANYGLQSAAPLTDFNSLFFDTDEFQSADEFADWLNYGDDPDLELSNYYSNDTALSGAISAWQGANYSSMIDYYNQIGDQQTNQQIADENRMLAAEFN